MPDSLPSNVATVAVTGTAPAPPPSPASGADPWGLMRAFYAALAAVRGDPMIEAPKLLAILDKIAASYRTSDLSAAGLVLGGLEVLIIGGDGITSTVYGSGDERFILKCVSAADGMVTAIQPDTINAAVYGPFFSALSGYLASVGGTNFNTLDAYASYINGQARYSFLLHPNAAYLNWLYSAKQPALLMTPGNVFAPQTQFGTATVGPGAGAVAYTDQAAIPTANVTTPGAVQQGYTPAPGLTADVTTAVNGTLAITVTGSGQSAAGVAFTGHTWAGVLDNAAAGAAIALTPAVAGDRISAITGIAGAGSAPAGAFSLVSLLERVVS